MSLKVGKQFSILIKRIILCPLKHEQTLIVISSSLDLQDEVSCFKMIVESETVTFSFYTFIPVLFHPSLSVYRRLSHSPHFSRLAVPSLIHLHLPPLVWISNRLSLLLPTEFPVRSLSLFLCAGVCVCVRADDSWASSLLPFTPGKKRSINRWADVLSLFLSLKHTLLNFFLGLVLSFSASFLSSFTLFWIICSSCLHFDKLSLAFPVDFSLIQLHLSS